ncbi:glycosyltransferase family 32 protein [Polaribacter sp. IC073]|uniref:glycosyltransferase family 32 protein n=1 Tax=Polaribacter sp. IC073 TaxID=2508540 RepID=UPI0011BEDDAA|nr:glycosyltransferase [Polaribacter sp. IC073]TXD47758.1 glycosyl transferase [Polaribacter sp. IC073]
MNAIPKIIHYCWFGPKPIPELELKCIESWKKYLPDYQLMFWDEKTFDVNSHIFSMQAYETKHYAFVSDFVRAFALKKYGGVYLDTDLEVLSNFSSILEGKEVVLGFENKTFVGTAFMASVKDHFIFNQFYLYYTNLSFVNSDGGVEIVANPSILAGILKEIKIELNGQDQFINGIHIMKRELFFPKKISKGNFRVTDETLTIHHFEGSWLTERQKRRGVNIFWIEVCRPILKKCKSLAGIVLGGNKTKEIEMKIRNWLK